MRAQRTITTLWILLVILALPFRGAAGTTPATTHEQQTEPPKRHLVIVVNLQNPTKTIELAELRRMFLRQKIKWPDGTAVTAYDQRSDTPARLEFSRRVLGKAPKDLNEYWLNLRLTRGLHPPTICGSTALLLAYLNRVKGGIGYAYEDELDGTVKRVEVDGLE